MSKKGYKMTKEHKLNLSKAKKDLFKNGYIHPMKGKTISIETRIKMSNSLKGLKPWNKGNVRYNKICKECNKPFKTSHKNKLFCNKNCSDINSKGKPRWNGIRKEILNWCTPFQKGHKSSNKGKTKENYLPLKIAGERSRITNLKRGNYEITKNRMINGGAIKARMANDFLPNNPEKRLITFFKDWNIPLVYTGNGSRWISNKTQHFNPDFIDEENRIIVEFDGKYWHKNTNDKDIKRNNTYNAYGYKLLSLNEDDINNEIILMNKIGELAV